MVGVIWFMVVDGDGVMLVIRWGDDWSMDWMESSSINQPLD